MKLNSQSNTILNDKVEKKYQLKKIESIGLIRQTREPGHEMWTTQ
jgi:hypothetical protein